MKTDFPAEIIKLHLHTLRKSVQSYSVILFSRIHTPYLSVFSPNAGKCRKNADQNNSEYRYILSSDSYLVFKNLKKMSSGGNKKTTRNIPNRNSSYPGKI